MKVHGTVTRVVDGKMFFRPADPMVFRKIATGSLTASGEIVVDAKDPAPEVGEEGDYDVGGDEDPPALSPDEDDPQPPPPPPEEAKG